MAAELNINATTLLRFEERSITGFKSQTLTPATQFLGADVEKIGDGRLSLHFYGWGRVDLADKGFNDDTFNGSLTYGYLQYRHGYANAETRMGRFFVRDGIISEHIDGISTRTELPMGFGLSAFGGATVHTADLYGENSDGKGNAIFGGRANYRYKGMLDVGFSGVYETTAPHLVNYTNGSHRLISGDFWLSPSPLMDLAGHTSYNTETRHVSEHSYLLNFKPGKAITLTGTFDEQHDRSYQYVWSMLSGAAIDPADKSRAAGALAAYRFNRNVQLEADYKHYKRERGDADRYGGQIRLAFLENVVRSGLSYHYLRADTGFAIGSNPSGSYHALRGYIMQDGTSWFSALDLTGYLFKDTVHDEHNALEATVSLGYHLTPALALSGDLLWGRNPDYIREIKGLVRLNYTLFQGGTGGKK